MGYWIRFFGSNRVEFINKNVTKTTSFYIFHNIKDYNNNLIQLWLHDNKDDILTNSKLIGILFE